MKWILTSVLFFAALFSTAAALQNPTNPSDCSGAVKYPASNPSAPTPTTPNLVFSGNTWATAKAGPAQLQQQGSTSNPGFTDSDALLISKDLPVCGGSATGTAKSEGSDANSNYCAGASSKATMETNCVINATSNSIVVNLSGTVSGTGKAWVNECLFCPSGMLPFAGASATGQTHVDGTISFTLESATYVKFDASLVGLPFNPDLTSPKASGKWGISSQGTSLAFSLFINNGTPSDSYTTPVLAPVYLPPGDYQLWVTFDAQDTFGINVDCSPPNASFDEKTTAKFKLIADFETANRG